MGGKKHRLMQNHTGTEWQIQYVWNCEQFFLRLHSINFKYRFDILTKKKRNLKAIILIVSSAENISLDFSCWHRFWTNHKCLLNRALSERSNLVAQHQLWAKLHGIVFTLEVVTLQITRLYYNFNHPKQSSLLLQALTKTIKRP